MRFLYLLLAVSLYGFGSANAADKANYKELTIASGASQSAIFDITNITPGNGSAMGLFMPAAWTTANITVLLSPTCGSPWYNAYDGAGNEYVIAAAASRYVGLDTAYFIGARCIKFVSGTSAVPVAQAGDRVLKIGYGRFNQ